MHNDSGWQGAGTPRKFQTLSKWVTGKSAEAQSTDPYIWSQMTEFNGLPDYPRFDDW